MSFAFLGGFFVYLTLIGQAKAGANEFPDQGCSAQLDWTEFNGHCYKLVTNRFGGQPADYTTIKDSCESVGPLEFPFNSPFVKYAYLADIQSIEENDFIAEVLAGGNRAWLGGQRVGDGFQWVMKDGDTTPFTFTNWKPADPNNKDGNENCVEINRGPPGKWNDLLCQRNLPGVCKYSIAAYAARHNGPN
ncbi:lectin BRA-3-like [Apostichopus japonicus]|uniref:lectin BRA-3-like n=1 Tax=Stichopus japonicus TaxID=307972 RepID=UPI003AB287E6